MKGLELSSYQSLLLQLRVIEQNCFLHSNYFMLKSSKSPLNLNSYKIDSKNYEDSLKQATQENQQLRTIITQLLLKQNRLTQELTSALQEIRRLRLQVAQGAHPPSSPPRVDDRQLRQERDRTNQYKQMYENQMQNKRDLSQYYERKLNGLLRDKDLLVKKYEQKIKSISQQTISNLDSSTSLPHRLSSSSTLHQKFPSKANQNMPSSPTFPEKFPSSSTLPQKSPPKLPPPPKHKVNSKPILPRASLDGPSSQILDNLLTPCLQKLGKMNLSLIQLRYIQQIDRFSTSGVVPKNKYIKLMREFPFECENEDQVEKSYEYLVTTLREEGKEGSGKNIIDFILSRMDSIK